MRHSLSLTLIALLTTACAGEPQDNVADPSNNLEPALSAPTPAAPANEAAPPPTVSEEPFEETSAQGAADVVQTYFALLEGGKFSEARALWSDGGKASGMDEALFESSILKYQEIHAEVGAPGLPEGAAGSIFVEVPVRVYGTVRGEPFSNEGAVTLRRCNNVDGCTPEQLKWRIAKLDAGPSSAKE